ncbi:MAG: hypothetical protein AB1750_03870 [Chloroflexota bacterium]
MTAQTLAMSPLPSSPPNVERSHLLRKLALLFLLMTALSLGLAVLFREKPEYPEWLQSSFAAVTLAVVAGFGSRWVLKRRSGFVRFVGAAATYLFGLFLLGLASDWKYGIGPLEFWPNQVDVGGLVQVGVGLYLFLLIFVAWRKRAAVKSSVDANPQPAPAAVAEPQPVPAARKTRAGSAKASTRKSLLDFLKPSNRPVKIRRGKSAVRKAVRAKTEADLPVRPRKRSFWRGRPKVRLAVVEEHRCPYCLEIVNRTDPRGVVECEVCHTLHHKDCWEITGVCQVPHYNS